MSESTAINIGNMQFKQMGFTLLELLVVVAIIAIVLSIAAPSVSNLLSNSRLNSETTKVVEALNVARSKAVSSHWNTVVAPLGGSNWNNGFQVFVDKDNDQILDDGELIQSFNNVSDKIKVNSTFANRVTYIPDGRAVAGSFYICSDPDEADYRRVVVAQTGRIRTLDLKATGAAAYQTVCP